MSNAKPNPKQTTPVAPEGEGESAIRRKALEDDGGVPLNTPLEDGQLRGVDEDGAHTGGLHGGPKKQGSDAKR